MFILLTYDQISEGRAYLPKFKIKFQVKHLVQLISGIINYMPTYGLFSKYTTTEKSMLL